MPLFFWFDLSLKARAEILEIFWLVLCEKRLFHQDILKLSSYFMDKMYRNKTTLYMYYKKVTKHKRKKIADFENRLNSHDQLCIPEYMYSVFIVHTCYIYLWPNWLYSSAANLTFHAWFITKHTIYSRNNMGQKCDGNCGLWVLNEIVKIIYPFIQILSPFYPDFN